MKGGHLNLHNLIFLAQTVPEGRVFGLDSQTLISIGIQLFNAILLAVVLGYLLYKPVKEFMQNRTNRIQSQLDDAEATMEKANQLIAQYNAKLKDIEIERAEIFNAARWDASENSKVIIEEAKREAEAIIKRARERVAADQQRLKEETRRHIIELAALIVEKYITANIGEQEQNQIFEETLAQMEEIRWQN